MGKVNEVNASGRSGQSLGWKDPIHIGWLCAGCSQAQAGGSLWAYPGGSSTLPHHIAWHKWSREHFLSCSTIGRAQRIALSLIRAGSKSTKFCSVKRNYLRGAVFHVLWIRHDFKLCLIYV